MAYQESAGMEQQINPFRTVAEQYATVCQHSGAKLEEARQAFQRSVVDYELADEAAFQAGGSADEAQKAYQSAHERMLALTAEEDSTKAASQMASTLADDALSAQIDTDADYGGLMSQALEALMAVSHNAEAELAAKKRAREQASLLAHRAHLEASTAHLSAQAAVLRRTQLVEQRLDAANRLTLAELEHRICSNRQGMADKLAEIQSSREALDETISRYHQVVAEAAHHEETARNSKAVLAELAEKLAAVGADIVPYETRVEELKSEEAAVLAQYNTAMKSAEQAYYLQMQKTEQARQLFDAEQEAKKNAAEEWSALHEANLARLGEAAARVEVARESYRVAMEQAAQAGVEVERNDALIAAAREKRDNISVSLDKARMTAGDTARMIANARAAKIAMKDDSMAVLANAEAILQHTLETAQSLAKEKEIAYSQADQEFVGLMAKGEKLRQAALQAAAAAAEAESMIRAAEAELKETQGRITKEEQQRREEFDKYLSEVRLATAAASQEMAAAEKVTASRLHEAEAINQRLTEISRQHSQAQAERDEKQQQINELNAAMEAETLKKAVDADKLALALWEQGEQLRLTARELGAAISRLVNGVMAMSRTEQTLLNRLSGEVLKCREKMLMLSHNNLAFLDEEIAARKTLIHDLAEYRQSCRREGLEADAAAVQVAETLLASAEHMENSGLGNWEADYTPEIEAGFAIDQEMLLLPIPQIEGDPDIQVNPLYQPEDDGLVAEGALDLIAPDSGFHPPVAGCPPEPPKEKVLEDAAQLTADLEEIGVLVEKQLQAEALPRPEAEATAGGEVPASAPAQPEQPEQAPVLAEPAEDAAAAVEEEPDLAAAALAEAKRLAEEAEAVPAPPQPGEPAPAAESGPREPLNPLLMKIMAVAEGKYQFPGQEVAEREIETIILSPDALSASILPGEKEAPAPAQPLATAEPEPEILPEPVVITKIEAEEIAEAAFIPALPLAEAEAEAPPQAEAAPEEALAPAPAAEAGPSLAYMEDDPPEPAAAEAAAPRPAPAGKAPDQPDHDPLNSAAEASRLAEEIHNLRSILAAQEEEARQAAAASQAAEEARREEDRRNRAQAEAARAEAERIRAEEEAAQTAAQEQAAQEEAERQRRNAAEASRLTRLAEEAAAQLSRESRPQPEPKPKPEALPQPLPEPGSNQEEEDDIETELRRLIFDSLSKQK